MTVRSFDLPRIQVACEDFLASYRRLDHGENATVLGLVLRELMDSLEEPDAS